MPKSLYRLVRRNILDCSLTVMISWTTGIQEIYGHSPLYVNLTVHSLLHNLLDPCDPKDLDYVL